MTIELNYNPYITKDGNEHQTMGPVRQINEEYEQRFNVKIQKEQPEQTEIDKLGPNSKENVKIFL